MKYLYIKKNRPKTILSIFLLATVLIIGIYACKKPNDGINIIVDTGLLSKAPTLVRFTNANINSTTALPSTFTVSVTGDGAKYVQVDGGGTDFTANNGYLPLSLTKNATPSATNPITFNVYAAIPGFVPVSKTITITRDSLLNTTIPLIEYASPVDGATVLVKTTPLNAGVAPVTVLKTATTNTMGQTATLTIPAGTQMLDAAGNVISSSNLNSSILQFGVTNPASAASIPGGLTAINAIGPNGTLLPGETDFVSAGMLSINMTADNTPVKKFSKPVQVSIDLPSGYINYDTGNPVAAGDVIPLWSQNEQSGLWTYEGTATVSNSNTGLIATFSITHLSYWNLDYYYSSKSKCSGLTIKFNPSSPGAFTYSTYYYLVWTSSGGSVIATKYYYPAYDGNTLTVYNAPSLPNTKIWMYDNRFNLIASTGYFNPCATSLINISYTNPSLDFVNVTVKLTALCTNKQVVAFPSGWMYVYDQSNYQWTEIYVYNGVIYNYININTAGASSSATANNGNVTTYAKLINGHTYTLAIYYSGKYYYTNNFVLTKGNITIPASGGLNGTATYNSATSSINIAANFTLTSCK